MVWFLKRSRRSERSPTPPPADDAHTVKNGTRLQDTKSALLQVARSSSPDAHVEVQRLLALGADVRSVDEDRETPLMKAAWAGNVETIKLLLGAGANVESRNWEGKTALMATAIYGHLSAAQALLTAGACADVVCDSGYVASSYAREGGNDEMARLLTSVPRPKRQVITGPLIDSNCAKCGRTPGDWTKSDGSEIVLGDGYLLLPRILLRCHRCGNWAELQVPGPAYPAT